LADPCDIAADRQKNFPVPGTDAFFKLLHGVEPNGRWAMVISLFALAIATALSVAVLAILAVDDAPRHGRSVA
jgi:hypothetical protein